MKTNNKGERNEMFWKTPEYAGGLMQGLGIGFVCSMIAVQLPNDFMGRVGMILLVAGVVVFVAGSARILTIRKNADSK